MAQRKTVEAALRIVRRGLFGTSTEFAACSMQIRFQHGTVPKTVEKPQPVEETEEWRSFTVPDMQHFEIPPIKTKKEMEFLQLCDSAEVEAKVGFIGGGNMAQAMIRGFLNSGLVSGDVVGVSDPFPVALQAAKALNVCTAVDNNDLLQNFGKGVVILAVKPDILSSVLSNCKEFLREAGVLVSIIAGAKISTIESALEGLDLPRPLPVVRVMPNTAAIVGSAASVFCRGSHCNDAQAHLVRTLMETMGTCHEVVEKNLDAVTGLSGSGPAFVYTMIDALSDGGVKMGLDRNLSTNLAAQTVMGAAKMVLETQKHPGELKNMVCSPGGTTITGVSILEDRNIRGSLIAAVEAATRKSQELGKH